VSEFATQAPKTKPSDTESVTPQAEASGAQVRQLREHVQLLEQRDGERAWEVVRLEARLAEITGSQVWRLAQTLRRARYAAFPAGSRRERFGRFCVHKLRRARYHARQGPRAFLRALGAMLVRPFGGGASASRARRRSGAVQLAHVGPIVDPAVGVPGLVSVILPVYNQADLLAGAIESVLRQTYADWELIVVNDGSRDEIGAVLSRYAGHPRVRILTQANQKLPKALSNGFEFAAGEFWTWTSADNLMEPQQLARQVEFLRAHPEAAMVYADYRAIDDRGAPLRDRTFRPQNRRLAELAEIHLPRETSALNTGGDNFIGACFLYRGWVGRLLGEYAPELGVEDYDYWMRMNDLFHVAHLGTDEFLYQYRVHDNTLNARAAELEIPERVRRLLECESQRQEFYGRPWTVLVDRECAAWVRDLDLRKHGVRDWGDWIEGGSNAKASDKILLLVSADSLDEVQRRGLADDICLAACFGDDLAALYRHRAALRDRVDACFCPNPQVAERAALFSRNVFHGAPGQSLFDLAIAFANNHTFYGRTVPAEQRQRRLPEPWVTEPERPRVLIQVDHFTRGGLEQVVLDLLAVLGEHGLPLSLLILGRAGPAADRARAAGAEVLTLPETDREAHYRKLLNDRRIEIVNAHYSLFGAAIAAELGIPFVQTIHNTYVFISPETVAGYRENDRYTTAYACVSSNVAMYSDLHLGLPVSKLLITPNGIDPARLEVGDRAAARARLRAELGLADGDFVFLNVASLLRDKAQRLLVAALAEVVKEYPRAKVVLLGGTMEAAYLSEVQGEVQRSGLERHVIPAGYRGDVAAFYAMADAFVLPSFWEGWSLALAEALCVGLPVIATDVGSARDVLPPTGAYLVPPAFESIVDLHVDNLADYVCRDQPQVVADLAAAMKRVCADPVAPQLSAGARQSMDRRYAYQAYVRLFRWLQQGGCPAAARAWLQTAYP
jgi:O-antigen biosynthesis protein